MRIGVIGLGQAGGRICDKFAYNNYKYRRKFGDVVPLTIAVNTAKSDLLGLNYIPMQNRIVLGATILKGHGAGARRHLTAKIMRDEASNIVKIAMKNRVDVDAYILAGALGGGTGSGTLPVLTEILQKECPEPIYAIGILPALAEGSLYNYNSGVALMELRKFADAMILWDNNEWAKINVPIRACYEEMNEALVTPFFHLCWAGEVTKYTHVGYKVLDAGDIIATLEGVTAIGWASEKVHHFKTFPRISFSRIGGRDDMDIPVKMMNIIQQATRGKMSISCDIKSARKAAFLISGPPKDLNKKGIEVTREFIEETIGVKEVRGGDFPVPTRKELFGIVILSGLTNVPRITTLLKFAVQTKELYEHYKQAPDEEEMFKPGEELLKGGE